MSPQVSPSVLKLIDALIEREGGYVDHPNDPGGPTRYGITEAIARADGYAGAMSELPRGRAATIYLELYFRGPGFDRLMARMPTLTEELVDTGVNMGPARAVRFLQRALNALNLRGRHYPDIVIDGRIGPRTIASVMSLHQRRGESAERVLLRLVEGFQATRYVERTEEHQASEDFLFGWILNRIGNVKEHP